jgi:predicted metal-dependent hydrolase
MSLLRPPQQLSLFDIQPASLPIALAPSPPACAPQAQRGSVPVPDVTPVTTLAPHAPGTVDHRHPQADREILLGESLVAYHLKRARRKSVGFVVSADGLVVTAPRWVGQSEIDKLLREKAAWLLRKLAEQQERRKRMESSRIEWRDGATLPFLGEPLRLVLNGSGAGAHLQAIEAPLPGGPRQALHLPLPHAAEPQQIRDAVQSWLQRQAKRVFEERCQHFAKALGVTMKRLSLSSAQTRWGSATADGTIRLNWRLIHFGLPVIDYVVAHELAHLREMNHSPAFWEVVRSVVPDFATARQRLAKDVLPPIA